ncbi:membrane-spanning 4-domains subfamily A member 12-like [Sinocyclocheilus anshuiensis]|uniref:Membrane-spanning 4-domains subfamily A member 12-like n=1 Tax=Sinocyclocheilus anshuiensis TaxID=1608454 RepID=A0A671M2D0_9TELE|nr:PREDICTED: membrane-spanning 4-domains subfamily A member 12-like [Sinocyclocheilus anshuiensis]
METSKVISTDKATVIIQVNPHEVKDSVIFVDGQEARRTKHNSLTEFFKAQPKELGIFQIIIGAMVFFTGIALTITIGYPITVISSGITYWGSFIYISAGSLSVAAQRKLNSCLVQASLGLNVVSAVTAGISILLMGIQLEETSLDYPAEVVSNKSFVLWIVGVMLVFTIPQFIISIFISAFACKATSNIHSTVVNVALK